MAYQRLSNEEVEVAPSTDSLSNTIHTTETESPSETTGLQCIPEGQFRVNILSVGKPDKTPTSCDPKWTVKQLKTHAFPTETSEGKNVRFIFLGREILDGQILEDCGIVNESFVHCSISAPKPPQSQTPEEAATPNANVDLEAGLSDIEREQQLQGVMWRRQASINMEAAGLNNGTTMDLVLGFLLGLFLGIVTLLWVWTGRPSRKQRIGIFMGIMLNLAYRSMSLSGGTDNQ